MFFYPSGGFNPGWEWRARCDKHAFSHFLSFFANVSSQTRDVGIIRCSAPTSERGCQRISTCTKPTVLSHDVDDNTKTTA